MATLAASLVVGCGDDDGSDDTDGGAGGSTSGGSKAGGGAGGSKAGSANGGSGGDNEPRAGAGGDEPGPVGGAGGEAGSGGAPTFEEIIQVSDAIHPQASDLRGLRFSADGTKIWASGHVGINANPSVVGDPDKQIVIARFNADGSPDTTFSEDGFLEVNLVERVVDDADVITNDGNEESLGIVELSDTDIVVSANVRDANGKGMDAVLARFTSAGDLVDTFGEDGVAVVTFGWAPSDDATFPVGGTVTFPSDNSWGVELDSREGVERLVVFGAGTAAKGQLTTGDAPVQRTDNDRYVARVLATTGEADSDFNGGLPVTYNLLPANYNDNARRGVVNADGSIIAGGYTNITGLGNHVVLLKVKEDGTRDTGFGFGIPDGGVVLSNPLIDDGGAAECYAVALQSTGRIVTTGYGSATGKDVSSSFGYVTTTAPDLVTLAISPDGQSLDEDWGNLGMLVIQSEEAGLARQEDRGRDLAALKDDRLVYAGNYGTDPAIFVSLPSGEFDPVNDVGQLITYEPLTTTPTASGGTSTSHFYRVVVSPDGKRIAASTNQNADGVMLAVLQVGE